MPLDGIDAVLGIENTLNALGGVWLTGRGVDIIVDVIIGNRLLEYPVTFFCEFHVYGRLES